MHKEQRRNKKAMKAKARRKDYIKKKNIIKAFKKEREGDGVECGNPVRFPKRKKIR